MITKGLKIFLVGGAVRDELLGLAVKEKDWVVVGSSPNEMLSRGFKRVGKDFPVFLHPITGEEYALARTERKISRGYYGFSCDFSSNITLEEDLLRRDLTINAMAKDPDGNIIDPFDGRSDLKARILRHVSAAFSEDPIRILRIARFAAKFANYQFSIAPTTKQLVKEMVLANELSDLTPERVWREIEKALITDNPVNFFQILKENQALDIIFPGLSKLSGIPQPAIWHPEIDTWIHTMLTLEQASKFSKNPKIRFAALCHDLGKGNTPMDCWPKHHGHEARGVKIIHEWCDQYKIPGSYRDLAVKVAQWHLHSHKALELTAKKILELFQALDAFRNPQNLEDFLLACKADFTGRFNYTDKHYEPESFLQQVFSTIQKIQVQKYIDQGLMGEQLGNAIRKERLRLIKNFKNKYQ